ncbi:MAG: hypothetical protein M1832_001042 [Thelocarpon impressellum]|nr:MAG: hypothetical protein M1832_001042 [Thelocarpon impressellum]
MGTPAVGALTSPRASLGAHALTELAGIQRHRQEHLPTHSGGSTVQIGWNNNVRKVDADRTGATPTATKVAYFAAGAAAGAATAAAGVIVYNHVTAGREQKAATTTMREKRRIEEGQALFGPDF